MLIGDPSVFAIESGVSRHLVSRSQMAVGYFLIHVGGIEFGVREQEASLLACSYDSVCERIQNRCNHRLKLKRAYQTLELVQAYQSAIYGVGPECETYLGLDVESFRDQFARSKVGWAPDGDEAFDDGSHIMQFDTEDDVCLIGFKNDHYIENIQEIVEISMDGDAYYGVLETWSELFLSEWELSFSSRH